MAGLAIAPLCWVGRFLLLLWSFLSVCGLLLWVLCWYRFWFLTCFLELSSLGLLGWCSVVVIHDVRVGS